MNCNLKRNWNNNICKSKVGEAEFRIVVPKRDNSGKPIKPQMLERYGLKMNKIFGGSTIYPKTKGV